MILIVIISYQTILSRMFDMTKRYILSILFLLIVSGCVYTPSIMGYNHQNVYMKVDKNQLILTSKQLHHKLTNFVSLGLHQYILQLKNKELVAYENAYTDIAYEFEPSIHRIVKVVFDAKSLILVYGEGHLYAYQLVLQNNSILNLIAYQGDTQHLQFIYGMSTKTLNYMIHTLNPNAPIAKYNNVIRIKTSKNPYISRWNDMKVHFTPLVVPIARFMGPF